jgi:hypothetical protein
MSRNEGVIISGNANITRRTIAMGKNARATENTTAAGRPDEKVIAELRHRLAELQQAIQANAAQVPNHAEVMSAAKTVENELAQPQPNKLTIKTMLGGVLNVVQSVSGIATAAEGLKAVLSRLL